MPQYKSLKSVAHNFGHSFLSQMNWGNRQMAMCYLVEAAKETGASDLYLDIKSKSWSPTPLIVPEVVESIVHYCNYFPELVANSNSSMELIDSANMHLMIDIYRKKETYRGNHDTYYELTVEITDNRGKKYIAEFKEYW